MLCSSAWKLDLAQPNLDLPILEGEEGWEMERAGGASSFQWDDSPSSW